MNSFAQVISFSRNSLILFAVTVMVSYLAIELANTKSKPSCYMINNFGEVVNLEDICGFKSKQETESNTTRLNNNTKNQQY